MKSIKKSYPVVFFMLLMAASLAEAQVSVKGYYRKDGTYVRPHQRTRPNNTVTDNYSYRGNYNPNTDKAASTGSNNSSSNSLVSTSSAPAKFTAPLMIVEPSATVQTFSIQIDTAVHTLELANELEFLRKSPEIREDNVIMGIPRQSVIGIYDFTTAGFTLVKFQGKLGFFRTKAIYAPGMEQPEEPKKKKRLKLF